MNLIQYNSLKYFALFCCLIVSCQSVVKQLYEDSTARFNSYFIAKEDIKKTEEIINNAYKWNYDDIIPIISPLDTNNVSQYNDLTINAIEKASLLIQRHPESSLVLNSYILIGLARLYNFDFESAETTFKYVNTKAKDINIKNLALMISSAVNYEGEIIWDKNKPDGTPRKLLDISKIKDLGWEPKISLNEGIEKSLESFKKEYNF